MTNNPLTYKDAGVDIDLGNELVDRIRPMVNSTRRPEVLQGLGGFGGLFALDADRFTEPVLVSGTDGVGTKLMLAHNAARHDTIGIDLVAMCVNDVLVQGAEPLFFLDYFACGQLDTDVAGQVISGIAEGCRQSGAALIGGETAEMPDMYANGAYDLAGFCVGVVERDAMIDGSNIAAGDAIVGLASSGPHSNGYSLIRKVLRESTCDNIAGKPMLDTLLEPTRIYVRSIMALADRVTIKGLAHITGGGLSENIPRVLPENLHAKIELDSWTPPAIFSWLAEEGGIDADEMRRTFNCGVGMVAIVAEKDTAETISVLKDAGEHAWTIGEIGTNGHGEPGVRFV